MIFAFVLSALLGCAAIRWPTLGFRADHLHNDIGARQALHTRPTPRIGGTAVILSFACALFFASDMLELDVVLALLAGLLVFAVGLREDIFRDMSPRVRLFAALLSGVLALTLSQSMVPGLGLSGSDLLFSFGIVALGVTLLWSAGTCHALNLIDGLNGLAAGYTIAAAAALYAIAGLTGDADIQVAAALLMASVGGFLVLNWPFGRIFMGDAGAYAIGHVLAWLCILLMARNPEVSGFAMLLVLFWPIGETTYSIIRRRLGKRATGLPDRMHFHHIVVRGLGRLMGPDLWRAHHNSLATLVLVPLFVTPMLVGLAFWDQPGLSATALAFFTALYILTYVAAVRFMSQRRARRARSRALPLHTISLPSAAELSAHSGAYLADENDVTVHIYRDHPEAAWRLRTELPEIGEVFWEERYETESEAFSAFESYLSANLDVPLEELKRAG